MARPIHLSFLVVVSFITVGFAGCLGGEEDLGSVGEFRLRLSTAYDASLRTPSENETAEAQHRSLGLPDGTPAREMVFQVVIRPLDGVDYIGWTGDGSCKSGFINHATGERREADCSATDGKDEITVPPPPADGTAGRHRYRLDAEGERVLVFPRPVEVAFRMLALYSDPLLAQRSDAEGCPELRSYARGAHDAATGAINAGEFYLRATGDGTVTMPYYGFCQSPPDA